MSHTRIAVHEHFKSICSMVCKKETYFASKHMYRGFLLLIRRTLIKQVANPDSHRDLQSDIRRLRSPESHSSVLVLAV